MNNNFLKDPGEDSSVKNIIFDTDAGPDGDDTAALTMLYHYADMGKVKILATVSDTSSPYGAPYLRALNTYYGYRDVLVGTLKSKENIMPTSRGMNFNIRVTASYETDIKDGIEARDATDVYREALSKAEDNSVTILVTGMQTNIADLLKSKADNWSDLEGTDLVLKKVKLISAMAGKWPCGEGAEFNIEKDIEAAQYVAKNCPVPIVYSGFSVGEGVISGPDFDGIEEDSPLKIAWWRMNSWDQTSAMYAVEGLKDFWKIKGGDAEILDDGSSRFTENNISKMRYYLVEDESKDGLIGDEIGKKANAPKKNNPNERKVYSISASETELTKDWTVMEGVGPGWREDITEQELMYLHTLKKALTVSDKKGAVLKFNICGSAVDVYGSKGVNYGSFTLYVDGEKMAVCNTDTNKQPPFASQHLCTVENLDEGNHEVKIVLNDDLFVGIDFIKVY